MNISYQIFGVFALFCISLVLTIIYEIEKKDAKTQEASKTKHVHAYLVSMSVMWSLFGIALTALLLTHGIRGQKVAAATGKQRGWFRSGGIDVPAKIPFKYQVIALGMFFIVALIMTIVFAVMEEKCVKDHEDSSSCKTYPYLATLIVFWSLFVYFMIIFLIAHGGWIKTNFNKYKLFRSRAVKAKQNKDLARQRGERYIKMAAAKAGEAAQVVRDVASATKERVYNRLRDKDSAKMLYNM